MQALLLREGGGVRLADIADAPAPGPGEIRIAMRLTPVNPADHLALEGRHLTDAYGLLAPMGAEGLGIVEATGEGVEGLAPGDRVLPLDRGNWVERRTISAERVIRAPDSLTDEQAALFRINPPTAFRLLDRVALRPGDWVIQNGAGSMIGRLIAVLGHGRGLRVACVVRSPEKARDRLTALGAAAIVADGDDMVEEALAAMGGAQARLALDCVTGAATGRMAQCLAPDGRLTIFGHLAKEPCSIPSTLLTGSGIIIDGYSLRPDEGAAGRRELQPRYDAFAALYASHPEILPDLRHFTLDAFETAVAARGAARSLIHWTAPVECAAPRHRSSTTLP